jgi:hypothetical protein
MTKKAHHYIPKFYLKGFTESTDSPFIWVYEQGADAPFRANIANVGHENYFYALKVPNDRTGNMSVENYLAEKVEAPANPAIERIRNRERLTDSDRVNLSIYLAVMHKRVPRQRQRVKELAPQVVPEVSERFDAILELRPEKPEQIKKWRKEGEGLINRLAENPPDEAYIPDYSIRVVRQIYRMTWQFLLSQDDFAFVTSDNPVFHFEGLGIGQLESELSFPISSKCVLWATNRTDSPEGYYSIGQAVVQEMNRRQASSATRYIYFPQQSDQVIDLANQEQITLHRITLSPNP